MTSLDEPLRFLTNAIKKRCTAFIISDFLVPDFEEAMRIASNKHDIVALKVFDPVEQSIPDIGLVKVADSESGTGKMDRHLIRRHQGRHTVNGGSLIWNILRTFSKDVVWILQN